MIPMLSRRDFLRSSPLWALAPSVPAFLARSARAAKPDRDGRALVVLELEGGNDGINTVVPFKDEGYAKNRNRLRLAKERLVKVTDSVGLHPSLAPFGKLLEEGRLSIVQGAGYPKPSRSHFRSMAIWQTARLDAEEHKGDGWLGRALSETPGAIALMVGGGVPPVAIRGRKMTASALESLDDFRLPADAAQLRRVLPAAAPEDDLTAAVQRGMREAFALSDRLAKLAPAKDEASGYPGSELARRLRIIAGLLKAGAAGRLYYTRQSGYDTHSGQLFQHSNRLFTLGGAVKAFLDDLKRAKLADRVVVLVFSEFGRTVKENGSAGTDHGTAGPVFLAGAGLKAGLVGKTPSLTDLDPVHGDLRMGVDFRRIYATVLEDWLGVKAKEALGGEFERLPLFRG
jgi:uncharacterized protein (DUF1501 family)